VDRRAFLSLVAVSPFAAALAPFRRRPRGWNTASALPHDAWMIDRLCAQFNCLPSDAVALRQLLIDNATNTIEWEIVEAEPIKGWRAYKATGRVSVDGRDWI
jgi:hypothetical protein